MGMVKQMLNRTLEMRTYCNQPQCINSTKKNIVSTSSAFTRIVHIDSPHGYST